MYKGGIMPSILGTKKFQLQSIDLIQQKVIQQASRAEPLSHEASTREYKAATIHYYPKNTGQPMQYYEYYDRSYDSSSDDSHSATTEHRQDVEARGLETEAVYTDGTKYLDELDSTAQYLDSSENNVDYQCDIQDIIQNIETHTIEVILDSASAVPHTMVSAASTVKCEILCSKKAKATQRAETLLSMRISDLHIQDAQFDSRALDAMQQFIDTAREKLHRNAESQFQYAPTFILVQPHTHISAFAFPGDSPDHRLEKVQLQMQLSHDGKTVHYTSINPRLGGVHNNDVLMCRQNCVSQDWCGKLPQIDYKCLYESIDALFAIVYSSVDTQFLVSLDASKHTVYCALYNTFKSMHFPTYTYHKKIQQYTCEDEHGKINAPYMPISSTICSGEILSDRRADITELTHMSILLDLHRRFVPTHLTFAYSLAQALLCDVQNLWRIRQQLMPSPAPTNMSVPVAQHNCDLFKYGMVLTQNEKLPHDFREYFNILSNHTIGSISSVCVVQNAILYGTTEMCTWGYTLACIKGAIKLSLQQQAVGVYGDEIDELTTEINNLVYSIGARFYYFHPNLRTKFSDTFTSHDMSQVSGGAMPLFCMAICCILDLSQTLYEITRNVDAHPNEYILETTRLMQITPESFMRLIPSYTKV